MGRAPAGNAGRGSLHAPRRLFGLGVWRGIAATHHGAPRVMASGLNLETGRR